MTEERKKAYREDATVVLKLEESVEANDARTSGSSMEKRTVNALTVCDEPEQIIKIKVEYKRSTMLSKVISIHCQT
jgi:hypothetical protein